MPPAGLKRGGAHNRRDRQSSQLSEAQCRLQVERGIAAWDAGQPLSRFITLAWGKAGIAPVDAVAVTGAFIDRARDWMRHHGFAMPWQWVQENGKAFGQHAHILLHVPIELDDLFRPMPLRWTKAILQRHYTSGTVRSERLPAAYTASIAPDQYNAVLRGKLNYMLKCAAPELEWQLDLAGYGQKPWGQSSLVVGKRAAVWQLARGG